MHAMRRGGKGDGDRVPSRHARPPICPLQHISSRRQSLSFVVRLTATDRCTRTPNRNSDADLRACAMHPCCHTSATHGRVACETPRQRASLASIHCIAAVVSPCGRLNAHAPTPRAPPGLGRPLLCRLMSSVCATGRRCQPRARRDLRLPLSPSLHGGAALALQRRNAHTGRASERRGAGRPRHATVRLRRARPGLPARADGPFASTSRWHGSQPHDVCELYEKDLDWVKVHRWRILSFWHMATRVQLHMAAPAQAALWHACLRRRSHRTCADLSRCRPC